MGIQVSKLNTDTSATAASTRHGNILQFTKKIDRNEMPNTSASRDDDVSEQSVHPAEVVYDELPPLPSLNMSQTQSVLRAAVPESSHSAQDFWPNMSQVEL